MRIGIPVRAPAIHSRPRQIHRPGAFARPARAGSGTGFQEGPCRERKVLTFTEIVQQQVFVKCIRIDVVSRHPHLYGHRVSLIEEEEVVRKVRVIGIFLPPVSYLLREFFCFLNPGIRFFPGIIFCMVVSGRLKGLWLCGKFFIKMQKPVIKNYGSPQIRNSS